MLNYGHVPVFKKELSMTAPFRRLVILVSVPAILLSACVVTPVSPDGAFAVYPPGSRVPAPSVLNVRLYPANESASQSGIITGTVANTSSGKGRFQLNYQGETMTGEATRSANDSRRGIASAYGPRGLYMNCEYQMTSAIQGSGECQMSDGGKFQVHIGG
jgi:hypothetical protein